MPCQVLEAKTNASSLMAKLADTAAELRASSSRVEDASAKVRRNVLQQQSVTWLAGRPTIFFFFFVCVLEPTGPGLSMPFWGGKWCYDAWKAWVRLVRALDFRFDRDAFSRQLTQNSPALTVPSSWKLRFDRISGLHNTRRPSSHPPPPPRAVSFGRARRPKSVRGPSEKR